MNFLGRTVWKSLFREECLIYALFARVVTATWPGAVLLCTFLIASCDSGPDSVPVVPDVPVLTAPLDASADLPNAVYLEWVKAPEATNYQLQVSMGADFSTITVDKSNITSTIFSVDELLVDSIYFWRVRARNDVGFSDWSVTWSFMAKTLAISPSSTVLSSPPNAGIHFGTRVAFTWTATEGARFYNIQASLEQDFFSKEADMTVESVTTQSVSALIIGYTYYWRVRAQNATGFGPWSPTWFVVIGDSN